MNNAERVRIALVQGNYRTTLHARQRMAERMVSDDDLMECGRTAGQPITQPDGKYKVKGIDLDGDDLIVICAWDGETVVITLF